MTDSNGYRIHLSDADVAKAIIDAAAFGSRSSGHLQHAVEAGVRTGRAIGRRIDLEPLDGAMRTAARHAVDLVREHDPGRVGLIMSLQRLDAFLDRYPSRGRPDPEEVQ